jgi:hypothetical protein
MSGDGPNVDYLAYVRSPSAAFPYSQRLQRLLIQSYAAAHGLRVGFYVAEIPTVGVFHNVSHLLSTRPRLAGLIFFTVEQVFPLVTGAPLLERLLASGYEARFATEAIVVARREQLEPLWELESIKRASDENASALNAFITACSGLLAPPDKATGP